MLSPQGLTLIRDGGSKRSLEEILNLGYPIAHELLHRYGSETVVFLQSDDRLLQLTLLLSSWWQDLRIAFIDPNEPMETAQKIASAHPMGILADQQTTNLMSKMMQRADPSSKHAHLGQTHAVNKPCYIVTSGSTGSAKVVEHTWRSLRESAQSFNRFFSVNSTDVLACSLPLHSIGGQMVVARALLANATVYLPSAFSQWRLQPSIASLVPLQLSRALHDPNFKHSLSQLRLLLLGGSPVDRELLVRARQNKIPVCHGYGASETAAVVCSQQLTESDFPDGFVGKALPGRKIELNEQGMIIVKGIGIASRIWQEGKAFEMNNQCFESNDLGAIDQDGLYVWGRSDDMLISGGKKFLPQSIEKIITREFKIDRALVVGLPSLTYGSVPVVVLDASHRIDLHELRQTLGPHLDRHKIPKAIIYAPAGRLGAEQKIKRQHWTSWALEQIEAQDISGDILS